MKLLERALIGILLVVAAGVVVHAPLTVWLGTVWPAGSEVVKSWKELLMAVALVLLIVLAVKRKLAGVLLRDRVMQLALVYAGLHFVVIGLMSDDLHAAGAGILIDLRYVLYFVLVYGTMRLLPQYRPLFIKTFIAGAVVVIGFSLLQVFVLPIDILAHIGYSKQTIAPYLTVDQNYDHVRINGTLRGPNPLGAYAMIVLAGVVAYAVKYGRTLTRNRQILLVVASVASGIVVGASYSRSALLAAIVAVAVVFMAVAAPRVRKWLAVGFVVAAVLAAGVLFALRDTAFVSNVILHENPQGGSAVGSNDEHARSLTDGVQRFIERPFGAGVGTTGSASLHTDHPLIIENQLLFIAHEVGWVGLGIFLWLFIEIMWRLWQRRASALALSVFASGCGLVLIGMLLPVWVDDTVSIIWWGLAGLAIATDVKRSKR